MPKANILKVASLSVTLPTYKNARLVDCNGDLSKRWYIVFYAPNVKGELKRIRVYDQINYSETDEGRRRHAHTLILYINGQLQRGYTVPIQENESETITDWINKYRDLHINKMRPSSIRVYNSAFLPLIEFIEVKKIKHIDQINKLFAIEYQDFLIKKYSNTRTINIYTQVSKSFFSFITERSQLFKSPFDSVKRLKEVNKQRQILTVDQARQLLMHLKEQDKQLYIICAFMYYAFMRPNEIANLKLSDIDLNQNLIHIPSSIAKNKQNSTIVITQGLKNSLEWYLKNSTKKNLLIGTSIRINTLSHRYNNLSKEYPTHTIYCWKHTGVVHHYLSGVGIKFIQQQCRHSSLDMTDKYLRSLKFAENSEMINKSPNLNA